MFQLGRSPIIDGRNALIQACQKSDNTSSNNKNDFQSFEQQLREMNEERDSFFGATPSSIGDTLMETPSGNDDAGNQHVDFEKQLLELKEERQSLFGFSQEEVSAWSTKGGNPHSHSSAFVQKIERARTAAQQQEVMTKEMAAKEDETTTLTGTQFTHLSPQGDDISMVDVGHKVPTQRVARARSGVVFPPAVMEAFEVVAATGDMVGPKGPIFATAKLAGIMGAKRTAELIPLCHPLPLDRVHIDIHLKGNKAIIECECRVTHKTGVEMEALTGASVAALTIYDMVKAVSHKVRIDETVLLSKEGGKRLVGAAAAAAAAADGE